MDTGYVEGVQKQKKTYFMLSDSKMIIAILALLFNDRAEKISDVQRMEAKKVEKDFTDCQKMILGLLILYYK